MDYHSQLIKCRNFLRARDTGVIATASLDGSPHASVVNYFTNKEVSEIYFLARQDAHKYKNINQNPFTCLVVCDDHFASSVEVKGMASQMKDGNKVNELLIKFARAIRHKNAGPVPIVNSPGSELFLFALRPEHFTYADFYKSHTDNGEFFEIYV